MRGQMIIQFFSLIIQLVSIKIYKLKKINKNLKYLINQLNFKGTGFSFTDKDACYARNQTQVSNDLFQLLIQFFNVFSTLKNNEFYLTGILI